MAIVPRAQVPGIQLQEAVRPQAEIVDSYVRPATPAKSNLWEMADALQSFSQDIKGLMSKRDADQKQKDAIRGQAAFLKNNSMGYAEAVRTGKIPSFASPDFVNSYKEAEGASMGRRLSAKFSLAYQQWDGRNDQDPAAFDKFMSEFLQTNLGTDDPYVLKGAMPFIEQLQGQGYTLNIKDRSDSLAADSINTNIGNASQDIDAASDLGLTNGEGTDYDGLFEQLIANRSDALGVGNKAEDYDKQLVDLISAKALEEGDPALLALLDRKVPGEDYTFAETPYGREVKARTVTSMETAQITRENRAYTQQEREQKALKDAMEASVQEALAADPNHVFDEEFLQKYSMVDPEARSKVLDLQRKFQTNAASNPPEDQSEVARVYEQIFNGADRGVIDEAYKNGVITEPSTYSAIVAFWDKLNGGKDGKTSPSFEDPTFKTNLKRLQQRTAPQAPKSLFYDPNLQTDASLAVTTDYYLAMLEWDEEHPNATTSERIKGQADIYELLAAGITDATYIPVSGEIDDPATYARPEGTGIESEPSFDLPTPAPMAAPESTDPWNGDTPPQVESLPPNVRGFMENLAKQNGLDINTVIERTWQEYRKGLQEQGVGQGIQDILDDPPASLVDQTS